MAIVLHARRGQAAPSLADFLSGLIAMDMMMNFPLIAIVELIAISLAPAACLFTLVSQVTSYNEKGTCSIVIVYSSLSFGEHTVLEVSVAIIALAA